MEVKEIFSTVNRRLTNIERYNNTPRIYKESVAEHSYFVSFYAMYLSRYYKDKINVQRVLEMCLVHDIEESISGDVPQNTKNSFPKLNDALEEMNKTIADKILGDDKYFLNLWEEYRDHKTLESKIVYISDKLSVLFYTDDEIRLGNTFMIPINEFTIKLLNELVIYHEEYKPIQDVVLNLVEK